MVGMRRAVWPARRNSGDLREKGGATIRAFVAGEALSAAGCTGSSSSTEVGSAMDVKDLFGQIKLADLGGVRVGDVYDP